MQPPSFPTDGVLTPFREGVAHASLMGMNDDQGGTMLTVTRADEHDSVDRDSAPDLAGRPTRISGRSV